MNAKTWEGLGLDLSEDSAEVAILGVREKVFRSRDGYKENNVLGQGTLRASCKEVRFDKNRGRIILAPIAD